MDWIKDNFQLILIAATAIAIWLNNRRRENMGEPADYDEDGVPDNRVPPPVERRTFTGSGDPEQEERVRRIQEEIRRKIAERRGQAQPPPLVPNHEAQEEIPPPMPVPSQRAEFPAPPPMPPPIREPDEAQAALERQRQLAEQIEAMEARRREALNAARAVAANASSRADDVWKSPTPISALATRSAPRSSPAAELRDPQNLRRAMVWREILQPPVALR